MADKIQGYSSCFKENAVMLSYERKSVKETALELGISAKLLSKWRTIYKDFKKGSFPGRGKNRVCYEDAGIFELKIKLAQSQLRLDILKEGIGINFAQKPALYSFIHQNRKKYPIGIMCQVLGVSRSMYNLRIHQPRSKREIKASHFREAIAAVFYEFKGHHGCVLIARELCSRGMHISEDQVSFFMKQLGLQRKAKKKYKATTDSRHNLYIAPNILNRSFTAEQPSKAWVSDITYIQIERRFLYLTVIIDLYDRKVVGWNLSSALSAQTTILPAWTMAIGRQKIKDGLIFHSDRGVQYANRQFTSVLNSSKCLQSMSRKGCSIDNAVAESFFNSLKRELVYAQQRLLSAKEMRMKIHDYIENWYNTRRRHSALKYKTIEEFNADI